MPMICPKCQNSSAADALFCDECGAPFSIDCSQCGEANRSGAKFCKKCGGRLDNQSGAKTAAAPVPSNGASGVAERMLASRRFIEGERKQLTVLFADIRGSTSFIEKLDPEDVRKHFDPVLRVMMDAVHRYDGTVNQVLGDGIMALFGAPSAREDHALRACYAALAMQEELRRMTAKNGATAPGALRIGIGINSGEVVVRSLTNDLNLDYSALGQTTHLAARMEALAGPGAIAMTAFTLREVEGFVTVKSLGGLQIKGFSSAIEAYELTGGTAARNRLQAAAGRGLSPFVGRQLEIEAFNRLTARAAAGSGQILSIVGEAGLGKSRLTGECIDRYLPSGWRVLEGSSVSYGKSTALFPVIDLLRRYCSIVEGDEPALVQAKVLDHVCALDLSLSDAVPPILALLDAVPSGSGGLEGDGPNAAKKLLAAVAAFNNLEPQDRRRQTFTSLIRLILRESHRQPLLVVFENLHWIDAETQTFLDLLVEKLVPGRILLLVNYRPSYSHTWANRDYYTRMRLEPLPPFQANELVDYLVGDQPELRTVKELLLKSADGNPFFVEESVRSLVEIGALVGEKGNYQAGVPIQNIRIPATVQTVLAERIDRLAAEEKQLLQIAAVIGLTVPDRLLRAVAKLPEAELRRALSNLQTAAFLVESSLFPDLEYKFTHALANEVLYGALLHEQRAALHARVMAALKDIAGNETYGYLEALAHHALRGERWQDAILYLRQSGNKAIAHSAFTDAWICYEQALEASQQVPESRERSELQIDLCLEARNVLFLIGDFPRVGEHLHRAEALAEQLGDELRMARVLNFLNSYYGVTGDPERAMEIGERTLALPATISDLALSTVARYYTGIAYRHLGRYSQARSILEHAMRSVGGELQHERFGTAALLSVVCRSHMVQCLAQLGNFSDGVCLGDEGIRIAEEANDSISLIHLMCSIGVLYLMKGDQERAISVLERGLEICQSKNISVYMPLVSSCLGCAYANAGRISKAISFLERGVGDSVSAGRGAALSLSTAWLSEGYLLAGRIDEARCKAELALELSKKHKERGHEAWVLKLLGDIAVQGNRPRIAEAYDCYERALSIADALDMRPLQAHCHAGLGNVCNAEGATNRAGSQFSTALDLYRSMDMGSWVDRTELALNNLQA